MSKKPFQPPHLHWSSWHSNSPDTSDAPTWSSLGVQSDYVVTCFSNLQGVRTKITWLYMVIKKHDLYIFIHGFMKSHVPSIGFRKAFVHHLGWINHNPPYTLQSILFAIRFLTAHLLHRPLSMLPSIAVGGKPFCIKDLSQFVNCVSISRMGWGLFGRRQAVRIETWHCFSGWHLRMTSSVCPFICC